MVYRGKECSDELDLPDRCLALYALDLELEQASMIAGGDLAPISDARVQLLTIVTKASLTHQAYEGERPTQLPWHQKGSRHDREGTSQTGDDGAPMGV